MQLDRLGRGGGYLGETPNASVPLALLVETENRMRKKEKLR
jgi:hypothetical protein